MDDWNGVEEDMYARALDRMAHDPLYREDVFRERLEALERCEALCIQIDQLKGQLRQHRAEWWEHLRTFGPMLERAKKEGMLDTLIEANVWPGPKCSLFPEDIDKSVEIAKRIRPQIEAEMQKPPIL